MNNKLIKILQDSKDLKSKSIKESKGQSLYLVYTLEDMDVWVAFDKEKNMEEYKKELEERFPGEVYVTEITMGD